MASTKQQSKNSKNTSQLWGGRFSKQMDIDMWQYSQSIQFDSRLIEYDIVGSIAHVKMLQACSFLKEQDAKKITQGLKSIYKELKNNTLEIDGNSEDVHSFVESVLQQKTGEVALKMHLGRSRNDQVAVDLHMYVRDQICDIIQLLLQFSSVLIEVAKKHIDTLFPGYTHLQRAEPIRFAHHILAYVSMSIRDAQRLQELWNRVNISPLGAGAFSGSPIPIDNTLTAKFLKFDGVYENSMDAVSDRDFAVELLSNISIIQMHFSKLSEELILWSSNEFGFIELDDAFCTGSSMMPQKKNPDLAELARGKTGEVYGALVSLLTTLKGLPLAYNRDLQEDKKPIFASIQSIKATIAIFTKMMESMKVNSEHTQLEITKDYSNATEIANYLSRKNIAFRNAHKISGEIVRYAISQNKILEALDLVEYKKFSPLFEQDIFQCIDRKNIIDSHTVRGGTAKQSIKKQFIFLSKKIQILDKWCMNIEKNSRVEEIIIQL